MSLGTAGEEVNAKKMQVFIGPNTATGTPTPATVEWKLLQNARVLISHPIFREPTTSGGVATYTGAPDNNISGTLLFTRDEWNTATNGFKIILAPGSGGEVPLHNWTVKFIDISGVSTNGNLTFANCKLSVVDISKSVEGAVKADITVICPGEPDTA
jgi:hypothetical protein